MWYDNITQQNINRDQVIQISRILAPRGYEKSVISKIGYIIGGKCKHMIDLKKFQR